MKNLIDLTGQKILVTGASSGIGRQTAITLSEVGAQIILVARREEELQKTLKMLSGEGHSYYVFDLNDLEQIEGLMGRIANEQGLLQGLAFCAGIDSIRPYKATTPDIMYRIMKLNFFSFYEMVRQFAKKKISEDGSKITVVSSVASVKPDKGQAAYAASKAAIDTAIITLSKELMPRHININSVRPAFVRTPLTQEHIAENGELKDNGKYHINMQPLGLIKAEDVAVLMAYLLSPAARMITGQGFDIDGGVLNS